MILINDLFLSGFCFEQFSFWILFLAGLLRAILFLAGFLIRAILFLDSHSVGRYLSGFTDDSLSVGMLRTHFLYPDLVWFLFRFMLFCWVPLSVDSFSVSGLGFGWVPISIHSLHQDSDGFLFCFIFTFSFGLRIIQHIMSQSLSTTVLGAVSLHRKF